MDRKFDEKVALCALNKAFGFEPRAGAALIRYAGGAAKVFGMDRDELRKAVGPNQKIMEVISEASLDWAADELDKIGKMGAVFTGITEPGYPDLLKECEDPPIGLYSKSTTPIGEIFGTRQAVGIVGTRDMSSYGEEWCSKIVYAMSRSSAKPLIVSGLAIGIDVTAHDTALRSGLPTVAVMPTGIDTVYPFRHGWIADKISTAPGSALVTDYPTGTAPVALNFLRRNRIIAGLSDAVIVVESKIKGGAMMTARLANSYDRPVYTLPGRVDDNRSQGCNVLLRDRIADTITSPEDPVERLGMGHVGKIREQDVEETISSTYTGREDSRTIAILSRIAKTIRKNRGISMEGLCAQTGLDYGDITLYTGMLENDGIISMDLLRRCTYNTKIL